MLAGLAQLGERQTEATQTSGPTVYLKVLVSITKSCKFFYFLFLFRSQILYY